MKTLKLKQLLATAWIVFALTLSSGIIPTQQFGFTAVPEAHAGCIGGSTGGNC